MVRTAVVSTSMMMLLTAIGSWFGSSSTTTTLVASAFRYPTTSLRRTMPIQTLLNRGTGVTLTSSSSLASSTSSSSSSSSFTTSTPASSSSSSTDDATTTTVPSSRGGTPPTSSSSSSSSTSSSSTSSRPFLARRLDGLDAPTVWQEFSPMAVQYQSVNLGQGYPDWDPPPFVIDAMHRATDPRHGRAANQYARPYAHMPLAEVLADEYTRQWSGTGTGIIGSNTGMARHLPIDPITQVATATGVTNVLYCALQGLIDPGDEVILLEPAFDIYSSQVQMAGGVCVYCPLRPDLTQTEKGASAVFTLDLEELRSKVTSKTRAIILNSPHNPTGKVFSRDELEGIADIVSDHPRLIVLSDEVYQHIVFDTAHEPHLSIATIRDGQIWDQTLTMSSAGKTFSCTGWKVGWAVGPAKLVQAVTAVQQWCNFSPVTPTQDAIAQALVYARQPYRPPPEKQQSPTSVTATTTTPITFDTYYHYLAYEYDQRRRLLVEALEGPGTGMRAVIPNGGFFIMADTSDIDFPYNEIAATQVTPAMPRDYRNNQSNNKNNDYVMPRDWALARWLTQTVGVTAIPPSSFYSPDNVHLAGNTLRFAFCKGEATLLEAKQRLGRITTL